MTDRFITLHKHSGAKVSLNTRFIVACEQETTGPGSRIVTEIDGHDIVVSESVGEIAELITRGFK